MRLATLSVAVFCFGCRPVSYVVPDDVSCPRCEIEIRDELEIGTADGPGSLISRPTFVLADGLGRIWVSMLDFGFPYVYGPDGSFLQQFGRPGGGPGEFRMAAVRASLPGDSVLLYAFPSYLVVGPDLTVGRTIRGGPTSLSEMRVVSWPGTVMASKIGYGGGEMTSQVLTIDFSGEQIEEGEALLTLTGTDASIQRRGEPVPPAGTWVSEVTRYRLLLHGPDGTPVDSLERRPDWFSTGEGGGFGVLGGPDRMPSTMVGAVRSDSLGRLWVYVNRPRPDWSSAWRGFRMPEGTGEVRVSSLPPSYELWRTTVEVIDPGRHRVVARADLDGHAFDVLGPDRYATFRELESGIPVVTIHRLVLRER